MAHVRRLSVCHVRQHILATALYIYSSCHYFVMTCSLILEITIHYPKRKYIGVSKYRTNSGLTALLFICPFMLNLLALRPALPAFCTAPNRRVKLLPVFFDRWASWEALSSRMKKRTPLIKSTISPRKQALHVSGNRNLSKAHVCFLGVSAPISGQSILGA